jgi:hypothetical protein
MSAPTLPLDRDKLYMHPRDQAVKDAHAALRPLNALPPEAMVAALAVLYAAVCERTLLDPQAVHLMGLRMLKHQEHHDKANKALQSLRDFAGMRIVGQEVTYS